MPAPRVDGRLEDQPTALGSAAGTDLSAPPNVAVMTMARDEGGMLDRWVRHYSHHVGVENLIVLDDNSADGSTDNLPCTVHRLPPLPGDRGFEAARMELASGLARGLLACYDLVAFVDVDEFLLPDPDRYDRLVDLLADRPDHQVIAAMALNVVHHVGVEGELDPALPVLGQRRFAKFVPLMCKPSIKRVPAAWRFATHGVMAPFSIDPELFMIHLKFHDREAARAVAARRRRLVDADGRAARSNWSTGGDEIAAMFEGFVGDVDPESVPEFHPAAVDLEAVVQREGDAYRASPPGQIKAMQENPLVRVPDRLLGLV